MRVYQFRHIRADAHCSPLLPPTSAAARRTIDYLKRLVFPGVCVLAALVGLAAARSPTADSEPLVQVVVELREPALADSGNPTEVALQQHTVERRIRELAPAAQVRWRYRIVLNGFSMLVPERTVERIERLPEVREVHPSVPFASALERSVPAIKANAVWGPALATSGPTSATAAR